MVTQCWMLILTAPGVKHFETKDQRMRSWPAPSPPHTHTDHLELLKTRCERELGFYKLLAWRIFASFITYEWAFYPSSGLRDNFKLNPWTTEQLLNICMHINAHLYTSQLDLNESLLLIMLLQASHLGTSADQKLEAGLYPRTLSTFLGRCPRISKLLYTLYGRKYAYLDASRNTD